MKITDLEIGDTFKADFIPAGWEDLGTVFKDIRVKIVSITEKYIEWVIVDTGGNEIGEDCMGGCYYYDVVEGELSNISKL